ncbi:MAG: alpha/beta hydrolase [Oculatellaceae cyanobacterium Prado106]|jgi:pimeloyl-ACP methyl ester carboxylesterase|nr:alpha/beta hydrolase [Oculatellaceae cyanobacterium Prado106]
MPFLEIRGVDHYYEWIGQPGQLVPSGKPVMVFIHGWAGSTRYWQSTALALANQFDCLLYDMRGFGRSHLPRPIPEAVANLGYGLDTFADDLALLLDALGLDRVYLNAHSTGGSVAVLFVNHYPQRVERAILTCNGVFEYQAIAFKLFHFFSRYVVAFRPSWLAKIPQVDRLFMARFLHRPLPTTVNRAFLEDFLMADYEVALGTVYTAVSQKAAEEMPQEFAHIQVPTLLISGEYDQIIPAKLGQNAAALNEKFVQHQVIPKTAHFPMLEDAETYLGSVMQFLGMGEPSMVNH